MDGNKQRKAIMKKRIIILITSLIIVTIGCEYEDFVVDYPYTAVYFPHELIDRTVITGEYMDIGVGVTLGGRVENNNLEWTTYEIDPGILDGTSYQPLPVQYYSVEDLGNVTIPKGKFQGLSTISIDADLFCADSLALTSTYALGFKLLDTSADSILSEKNSTIITFKYINTYHGNYYHKGQAIGYSGGTAVETVTYPDDDLWELNTFSVNGVTAPEMANFSGSNFYMDLTIAQDNSVSISSNPTASVEVSGNGNYNPDTRTFILEYNFTHNELDYTVKDTLYFRNRIVDGINQWDL